MIFIPAFTITQSDKHFTIKPEMEFRARYERRTDADFNGTLNDNKSYFHSRFRPGFKYQYGDDWGGLVQYQYAHTETWSHAVNSSLEYSDLFQAYAEHKMGDTKVKFGRQKLDYESTRLIGSPDWGNSGRTYDGVRVQTKKFDAFAVRLGVMPSRPNFARYFGLGMKNQAGSTTLIYKHDVTATGDVDHYTLDEIYSHNFGKVKFEGEGALQQGRASGKDQQAWAAHLQLSEKCGEKASTYFEVNSASGGSSTTTTRTFDNLSPSNHGIYGSMDLSAWKNLNQIAFGVKYDVKKDFSVGFRAATNDLRDPSDGWYNSNGALNKSGAKSLIDATGNSGRHLGEEYDLEFSFKPKFKGNISAGIAMFTPGTFVKNVAGASHNQYWGYLQYSAKF